MWWIPVVMIGGYVAKKIIDSNDYSSYSSTPVDRRTTLEKNMSALHGVLQSEKKQKIALLGQPGSGKSTILNKITAGQCIPLPIIGQKTDATNWHKELKADFFNSHKDIKFVDIPGYDTNEHPVSSYLEHFPFKLFDQVVFVLNNKIHDSDIKVFNKLIDGFGSISPNRILIVRNYTDSLDDFIGVENDLDKLFNFKKLGINLVFSSGRSGAGMNQIMSFCKIG